MSGVAGCSQRRDVVVTMWRSHPERERRLQRFSRRLSAGGSDATRRRDRAQRHRVTESSLLAGLPDDGFRWAAIRPLLLRPPGPLRGSHLGASRSAHLATFPRLKFCAGCRRCALAACWPHNVAPAAFRCPLLRPTGALRRRDLCPSGCAQPATPPRPELRRRRNRCASSALHDRACIAPKIGKVLNKGPELRLKLFVPMLSAASREFKNRRRSLWHSHR